jgi:hypothetical protein
MTDKQKITWTGSDEHGYTGTVNGVRLYKVRTVRQPPVYPGQKRPKYLYLARRLNTLSYEDFCVDRADTIGEAKTNCEIDFVYDGGRAALHKILGAALLIVEAFGFYVSKSKILRPKDRVSKPALDEALATVRAAGYRIRQPKTPKPKGRPGPVFACEFSDGSRVRMSVACSTETLDWVRGERLARQAWASRHKVPLDLNSAELAKIAPPINVCRFERDGVVLAQGNGGGVA